MTHVELLNSNLQEQDNSIIFYIEIQEMNRVVSLRKFASFNPRIIRCRLPSLLAILMIVMIPPDGFDFSVCLFQHLFDLPCPACGLTRSMASILHFEWVKSFLYHPLGGIVLAYLILCLVTNQPDYLKSKLIAKRKIWQRIISYQFVILLFLGVWIARVMLSLFINF
jgi:hypothetical protein